MNTLHYRRHSHTNPFQKRNGDGHDKRGGIRGGRKKREDGKEGNGKSEKGEMRRGKGGGNKKSGKGEEKLARKIQEG